MGPKLKDSRLPKEAIPLIIAHWWDEYYYGGGLTVLDLRKFLETKLRDGWHSREAVAAWIYDAESWKIIKDCYRPGYVDRLLGEYFQVYLAA